MEARRARILRTVTLSVGLAISLLVGPANAATCSLSAPYAVRVGDPVNIVGTGFRASTTVDVSLTIDDGTPDEFTTDSNAAGGFQISLTAEAADIGTTTVVAMVGATCSATINYTVVGAGATLPPKPTATTRSGGTGAGGAPPRTDAASASSASSTGLPPATWIVAVLSLVIGLGGLAVTRPSRGR